MRCLSRGLCGPPARRSSAFGGAVAALDLRSSCCLQCRHGVRPQSSLPDAAMDAAATTIAASRPEFYKRELPSNCIPFHSAQGKLLFAEALAAGTMECYFPLAAQFRTQDEPAFCGLSTLVMTLNALSIDPRRLWKGPWRWFTEDMLDCCRPVDQIKEHGLDLDLFVCLARCNSAAAELVRATPAAASLLPAGTDAGEGDPGLRAFRAAVVAAAKQGEGEFMVLSYSRKALGQTGDGHFSPLGGYHAGRDMVLIMDVARFKYPPHWVPLGVLWSAMQLLDAETALPRGYVTLRRLASAPLLLFHLPAIPGGSEGAPSSWAYGGASSLGETRTCMNKRLHISLESGLRSCREVLRDAPSPPLAQSLGPSSAGRAPESGTLAAVELFVSTLERATGALPLATSLRISNNVFASSDGVVGGGGPIDALGARVEEQNHACDDDCNHGLGGALASLPSAKRADIEEPRCIDKLSREHIVAAAALIADLEDTSLYPLVVAALRRYHESPPAAGEASRESAGEAGTIAVSATASTVAGGGSSSYHGAEDSGIMLTSESTGALSGARSSNIISGAAGARDLDGLRQPALADRIAALQGSCDSHGLSCIRVRKSHVLTMLLLAFTVQSPLRAAAAVGAFATSGPARARSELENCLILAAEQCIVEGSLLLKTEASVIREQLLSANCVMQER